MKNSEREENNNINNNTVYKLVVPIQILNLSWAFTYQSTWKRNIIAFNKSKYKIITVITEKLMSN